MSQFLDAHQHFWSYSAAEYPWIPPGSALHRDWLPADLEQIQAPLGGAGSIAVQARQSLEESRWLLELADRFESIRGVVGWVDLRSEAVEEQLARFAGHEKFVGVRHVVQDEVDDRFLVGKDFLRGVRKLEAFGLRYDLLIFPKQLPAAIELVQELGAQPFVLDHCAKPHIQAGELEPWAQQLRKLGSFANVSCKVSGIVTEADWTAWSLEGMKRYLDVVEDAFGRGRLMWGSDWPVCLHASSYERWVEVCREWTGDWSEQERAGFWGGNAAKFYGV
ncbi:MAG: amidohydrolase family protein [Verrucomicrobiota bacterium]